MGGGIKSKFKFPVPGRSSKKQQAQSLAVPVPLSKAQRILGADGINIGSSRLAVDPGRAWETSSTGAISISISESSASEAAHDVRFEQEDGRKLRWEEESAIIPRNIRSAQSSAHRGMVGNRSPYTGGNESRDNVTSTSIRGRRLSSSTIDTHYDAAKMPLAISQQTSNSAMAKGLPTKINELLDMDGSLAGPQTMKKKKPTMLDLSRLRPRGHKDRNRNSRNPEPILGNNYVMRSPSVMAQTPRSPQMSSPTLEERQRTPRKRSKQQNARQSPRSKGVTEAAGLHQLYHHYEQMSFQNEHQFTDEVEQEHLAAYLERNPNRPRPASTFTHSLIAPLPVMSSGGHDARSSHSRNNSHDSRIAASIAELSSGLQVHSGLRKDYAGSVSSRHTRTSKASPSSKSLLESDRLQSSVLSLSDSSDDEATGPTSSAPSYREGPTNDDISDYSVPSRVQNNFNYPHGAASPRKFTPSLNQVDEHLAVRSAPRTQTSRSPSYHTGRSSQSSMNTLTPVHSLVPLAPDSRMSSRSAETIDTLVSSQAGYSVQEARAVAFVPLASTAEAASIVSQSGDAHHLGKALLRQNSSATSHISHSSDQPTPPLSPNSVEFYMPSRESLQRQAMASGSSEAHNARMMAVTRQEEMLLAALRQKRAKMRETVISESEEDGTIRPDVLGDLPTQDNLKNAKRPSPSNNRGAPVPFVNPWPQRASSLFIRGSRENLREADQQHYLRADTRDTDVPSTASRSDATDRTSTSATGSTALTTPDSRHEQISLFLEHRVNATGTRDSSLDFSDDYMDDSDGMDLVANERRSSRMQTRRDSASGASRGHRKDSHSQRRGSSSYSTRSQSESISTDSLGASLQGRRLQDVPEVEYRPTYTEHEEADDLGIDDLDGFPQPPMPPPSWPLPPRPGKPTTKQANSPPSAGLLHPSSAVRQGLSPERKIGHKKSKRSMVRLSAVGSPTSPMPWWGDDD